MIMEKYMYNFKNTVTIIYHLKRYTTQKEKKNKLNIKEFIIC